MPARLPSALRLACLTTLLVATVFFPALSQASSLADAARQLAHKVAAASGPGAFSLQVTNRSSLDEKSVREARISLESELRVEGVYSAKPEQAVGTITVVLSESLREYVWTAEIAIGSDEKKVALVSLPRPPSSAPFAASPPMVLKATLLFTQERRILDVAAVEMPTGSRLLVLDDLMVAMYRQAGTNPAAKWEPETSSPILHSRIFPRDLRGRLLLRRDHLFDVYLPGTICHSTSNPAAPLACNDTTDPTYNDPWPLTPEDGSVRAFYAASRNFFTGALSPGIGKVSNVPSFYSAAPLPRSGYTLWAIAAVDGSLHLVDGMTDQLIRGAKWGSDLAAIRSTCGPGTQLLISDSGNPDRDSLRAFEVPDRDPAPASSPLEFAGQIVALWSENSANSVVAVIKRKDTGWYEAYRISISCSN